MTTELEEKYYSEQVPDLLSKLERIAIALEKQAAHLEDGRRAQEEALASEKMRQEAASDERRKTIAKQLSQLGEVEKMAAELKRRMEAKRDEQMAAIAAAKAGAAKDVTPEPASGDD